MLSCFKLLGLSTAFASVILLALSSTGTRATWGGDRSELFEQEVYCETGVKRLKISPGDIIPGIVSIAMLLD